MRKELEEKIKRRELELQAHGGAKPIEVPNPATTGTLLSVAQSVATELSELQKRKRELGAVSDPGDANAGSTCLMSWIPCRISPFPRDQLDRRAAIRAREHSRMMLR